MKIAESIKDFFYVRIMGKHKHLFKYDHTELIMTSIKPFSYPIWKCISCSKTLSLEQWQIESLPASMKYEKREVLGMV